MRCHVLYIHDHRVLITALEAKQPTIPEATEWVLSLCLHGLGSCWPRTGRVPEPKSCVLGSL